MAPNPFKWRSGASRSSSSGSSSQHHAGRGNTDQLQSGWGSSDQGLIFASGTTNASFMANGEGPSSSGSKGSGRANDSGNQNGVAAAGRWPATDGSTGNGKGGGWGSGLGQDASPAEGLSAPELPPAARTSLIMPHLKKRFTLLRAPDGTMVTADAMRAHLRAQRARARAIPGAVGSSSEVSFGADTPGAGGSGSAGTSASYFLTEEEENEIIDELERQTRLEASAGPGGVHGIMLNGGFGAGTDGFGGWGTLDSTSPGRKHVPFGTGSKAGSSSATAGLDKISEALAQLNTNSASAFPDGSSGADAYPSPPSADTALLGSPVTPKSAKATLWASSGGGSEREAAYMRKVAKERATRKNEGAGNSRVSGTSQSTSSLSATGGHGVSQHRGSRTESSTTASAANIEGVEDVPMPGAFSSPSVSAPSALSEPHINVEAPHDASGAEEESHANAGMLPGDSLRAGQDPLGRSHASGSGTLLANLSPEAFKRVSTALEEVFGMVAADAERNASIVELVEEDSNHGGQSEQTPQLALQITPFAQSEEATEAIAGCTPISSTNSAGASGGSSTFTFPPKSNRPSLSRQPREDGVDEHVMEEMSRSSNSHLQARASHQLTESRSVRSGRSTRHSTDSVGTFASATSDAPASILGSATGLGFSIEPPAQAQSLDICQPSSDSSPTAVLHGKLDPAAISTPTSAGGHMAHSGNTSVGSVGTGSAGFGHGRRQSGQGLVSIDPANGKMQLGLASPTSNTFPAFTNSGNGPTSIRASAITLGAPVSLPLSGEGVAPPTLSSVATHSTIISTPATDRSGFMQDPDRSSSEYVSRETSQSPRAASMNEETHASNGGETPMSVHAEQVVPVSGGLRLDTSSAGNAAAHTPTQQTVTITEHARSGSAAEFNSVITASAIAARSASYFPSPPAFASKEAYADGFLPPSRVLTSPTSPPQGLANANVLPLAQPKSPLALALQTSTLHKIDGQQFASPISAEEPGSGGLFPLRPQDPELAQRWRETYGIKAADAASMISADEEIVAVSDDEAYGADDDDVWAKVARHEKKEAEAAAKERPVSHIPTEATQQELEGAGLTYNDVVNYQNDLVRSASTKRSGAKSPPPPLPATPVLGDAVDQNPVPALPSSQPVAAPGLASPFAGVDAPAFATEEGRGVRPPSTQHSERTMLIDSMSEFSTPSGQPAALTNFPNQSTPPQDPGASPAIDASHAGLKRRISSRSGVMYDVTSSHRPSSPPPRSMSPIGLPTIRDLSENGFKPIPPVVDPHRQSMSLSQALEAAMLSSPSAMHQSLQSALGIDEEASESINEPANTSGYMTSPSKSATNLTHSRSYDALTRALSPASDDTPASDPGHLNSPRSPPPVDMEDDIAAQARAATHALKGPDHGVYIPPRRSRLLSRSKSTKKLNNAISGPQLISTTQRLDHATSIPAGDPKLSVRSSSQEEKQRVQTQQAISTLSSGTNYGGSSKKENGHTRRSSSFGHQAASNMSLERDNPFSTPTSMGPDPSRLMWSAPTPTSLGDAPSRQSSLGRWMSKLSARSRKISESNLAFKIDPFPASDTPPMPSDRSKPVVTPITSLAEAFPSSAPQGGITMAIPGTTALRGESLASASPASVPTTPQLAIATCTDASRLSPPRSSSLHGNQQGQALHPLSDHQETLPVPPLPTTGKGRALSTASQTMEPSSATGESLMDDVSFDYDAAAAARWHSEAALSVGSSLPTSNVDLSHSKRKSARDTIVRRTLIIPSAPMELLDDKRKSAMSLSAGTRKSRKAENFVSPAATTKSASPTPYERDQHQPYTLLTGKKSLQDRPPTPPGPAGVGGAHRRKPSADIPAESPMPSVPPFVSAMGFSVPKKSMDSLRPFDLLKSSKAGRRVSAATSAGAHSGYAGSLYDMYLDDDDEDRFSATSQEVPPIPAEYQSRSPIRDISRSHIEVTQRADGSVVWQVIAGLADRSSTYSDGLPGTHSRSSIASPMRDSFIQDPGELLSHAQREDTRNFLATHRQHKKLPSLDADNLALPVSQDRSLPNTPTERPESALEPVAAPQTPPQKQKHLGFEMATPQKEGAETRIIYTSDSDLAVMLESLARGNDSAKFEIRRPDSHYAGAVADKGASPSDQLEAEQHAQRLMRVEAEIYSLLAANPNAEEGHA
ncbi:hypothetical protein K437DRAFT_258856 [Tilletiaria anomala UBC 951]|uniref:Uncharacterized protein n=1 Tax=Tilletiaria anomala (strain ATCC 24038 / CBS 436.72 / UBC 951) TaxID=1037660 RepID=A0A066VME1_TILAU|nr:uncharacterized protein K437DRAFT_258856 [Tilletiaria anomala UBC 951]KDN39919.1 hypothetical protein K437DRAFT_258856 [Tilletiaria anomala UBC 951]